MEIVIVENDVDMLTVKLDGKVFVFNKEYGYWYDDSADEIIDMDPAIDDAIFKKARASDRMIEDFPNFVYQDDDDDEEYLYLF